MDYILLDPHCLLLLLLHIARTSYLRISICLSRSVCLYYLGLLIIWSVSPCSSTHTSTLHKFFLTFFFFTKYREKIEKDLKR